MEGFEEAYKVILNQRFTMSLVLAVLGAAATGLCGFYFYRNTVAVGNARFEEEASAAARMIAGALKGKLFDLPTEDIRKEQRAILERYVKNDPRILFAALIDKFRKVQVEIDLPEGISLDPPQHRPMQLSMDRIMQSETPNSFPYDGEYYLPVYYGGDALWGQLRIVWNLEPLKAELRMITRRTLYFSLGAFLIIGLAVYILYGRLIVGGFERLADAIDRIVSSGMRGRLEPSIMSSDMVALVTQVNRVLAEHEHDRKRVLLLEDSLRQSENTYQDYKSRMSQTAESMEREKTMALLAFHEIFGNTADGILVADHAGEIAAANRPARRWLALRESQGEELKDNALLNVVQRLTRDNGEDNAECSWTYRDPMDGQSRHAKVHGALLERHEGGRGVVMLHILPDRNRRGADGKLEELYRRFLDEVVLPALKSFSAGGRASFELHLAELNDLVHWSKRLRAVGILDSKLNGHAADAPAVDRFDLGPWLGRHLQVSDLFAQELSVRLYPPEVAAMVAVPEKVLEIALDSLIAFLCDTGRKNPQPRKQTAEQTTELLEWVLRLERDTQNRAELVIAPSGDFKLSKLSHLNVLREATESVGSPAGAYTERLNCRQEIALVAFLTSLNIMGGALRVTPGDRKTPPTLHWVLPHPEQVSTRTNVARRLRPKTQGVESLIERFFGG